MPIFKKNGKIKNMKQVDPKTVKIAFLAVIAIFLNVLAAIIIFNPAQPGFLGRIISRNHLNQVSDFKTFSSEDDFKKYLASAPKEEEYYGIGSGVDNITNQAELSAPGKMAKDSINGAGGGSAPDRFSQTNVQIAGIDEPDIVKTDGKEIYFSGEQRFYPMMRGNVGGGISWEEEKMIELYPYPIPQEETKIIKAFPPADLALDGKIDKQGDLLLSKNILIVFGGREITGFNVANPKSPKQKWSMKLDENVSIVASRLYGDKVYLITRNAINEIRPCPFIPFSINGAEISILCQDIYHPIVPVSSDVTFTAAIINPADGKIEKTVSFIGSSNSSIIYMSENSIYAAYTYSESAIKFFIGFAAANQDLFPVSIGQKMRKLDTYDISENSKMTEFSMLMEKYVASLDRDSRLKAENEMQNRMTAYYKIHERELEKTGIVKIDLGGFKVAATGTVPGHLLNNFAMDEYQDNLRVATTISSQRRIFSGIDSGESVSDVYVLDKSLKTIGSVKNLGKTERIYSARFIEDKGYIVTFRQTDPFYVLDLANPKNPIMAGELKIPGYSSYLHPLDATHILGVGMEGSKVKISLFDVSDKNNPIELDKYLLDEYWTEVSNNYHAFLLDKKHNIFFLPGSKGGYVFSYFNASDGLKHDSWTSNYAKSFKLKLEKAISQNSVKRAIYLNDYLYIIGEDKITVLNELDWQKVNELDLSK